MKRLILFAVLFLALTSLVAVNLAAEEAKSAKETEHSYVGAKKCKICHKDKHASWSETPHAKTYDLLSDEEKKGDKCTKCHVTGTTKDSLLLEGTQCEACHGPGSAYKSAKIMSKKKWKADPEGQKKLALEAGLVYPDEKVCVKCHTKEGNPNYKSFDFAESKDKVHPVKAKEK